MADIPTDEIIFSATATIVDSSIFQIFQGFLLRTNDLTNFPHDPSDAFQGSDPGDGETLSFGGDTLEMTVRSLVALDTADDRVTYTVGCIGAYQYEGSAAVKYVCDDGVLNLGTNPGRDCVNVMLFLQRAVSKKRKPIYIYFLAVNDQ